MVNYKTGEQKMKVTTIKADEIRLEKAILHAEKLMKMHNCDLIELIVMSLQVEREKKVILISE